MAVTQSPSGVGTAFVYNTQVSGGDGYSGMISAVPPPVNPPIIFEPMPSLTQGQASIWIVVTGPTDDWGGCQIWGSVDGGGSYGQLGVMMSGGTQGTLISPFPFNTDPDTTDTLSVDTSICTGTIDAAGADEADVGVTLAYVDGELVGYSNVTLVATAQYNLDTYLRRGMFDSPISAHAAGTQFGLIGGHVFSYNYSSIMIGRTIYFKFVSFNSVGGGLEDIAGCTAYPYTLTGVGLARGIWATPVSVGGKLVDLMQDPWDNNYEIFDVQAPWSIQFSANLAGSPAPGCEVPPASDVNLGLQTINSGVVTPVGTLTILAGQTTGNFNCAPFALALGARMRLYAPYGVDPNIAGLYGTVVGARD